MNGKDQQPKTAILLIGVGNDYRGDDGVGLLIARRLKALRLPNVAVIEEAGDVAMLMEEWTNADVVMVFDAVRSGAEPGTIHRFDAHVRPIPVKPAVETAPTIAKSPFGDSKSNRRRSVSQGRRPELVEGLPRIHSPGAQWLSSLTMSHYRPCSAWIAKSRPKAAKSPCVRAAHPPDLAIRRERL